MLTRILKVILICIFSLSIPESYASVHGGGLMVAPNRLMISDGARSTSISLFNSGTETSTYRISTENSRMSETGERTVVTDGGEPEDMFADRFIRFAPRQITLKPGEEQTVRISTRLPRDLKEGEYRTGLNFQWIPDPGAPKIGSQQAADSEGISVKIDFSFGITVPVIIRHGNLSATGSIAEAASVDDEKAGKAVEIKVLRQGNRSLYGEFSVFKTGDGKEELLTIIKGVAIYVPNPSRIIRIALPEEKVKKLTPGKDKLRIEYREPSENGGKIIAEKTITY